MTFGPLARLAVVVTGLTLVAGCGRREPDIGVDHQVSIAWEGCGAVDCANLVVPLNPTAPRFAGAATITLRAYRQLSEAPGSRHVPLIVHPGGPGADVRAAVEGARAALSAIIDDFDIYALSTRGTVDGTAFDCGKSLDDLRMTDVDPVAAERFAEGCLSISSKLVGRMGTRDSVDDLEAFRVALGFEHVRFLGWSYGATLGAAWAMEHPTSLRSLVLDAPTDPRVPANAIVARRREAAARAFALLGTNDSFDDVGNARESALAREYLLYEPTTSARGATLTTLRLGEMPDGSNDGGIETQIGVHCSDVTHAEARRAIAITEKSPGIGFGATFDRVCLALPETDRPLVDLHVNPIAERLDAMVVSNTGDHVVPAAVSRDLARSMRWRSVEVEGMRHLSVGFDPVATKKAMAFLDSD